MFKYIFVCVCVCVCVCVYTYIHRDGFKKREVIHILRHTLAVICNCELYT